MLKEMVWFYEGEARRFIEVREDLIKKEMAEH